MYITFSLSPFLPSKNRAKKSLGLQEIAGPGGLWPHQTPLPAKVFVADEWQIHRFFLAGGTISYIINGMIITSVR